MTIKDLMKKKHITQDALAERLNCSQGAVSLWCTGKSYPHITTIFKIAQILSVPVDDVVECFKEREK